MNMTAIVLAGGKGTRIASLYPQTPKPMIPVAGQPFLHWVTEWLITQGVTDIVYSVGHLAEQVEDWAKLRMTVSDQLDLRCVRESIPLGTGGAIRHCLDQCTPCFLAMNGDSLMVADLRVACRRLIEDSLDGVVIAVRMADSSRYGSLEVDDSLLLRGFFEKRPGQGLINAGIYLFRSEVWQQFPTDSILSLEQDVIPTLLDRGARIGVMPMEGDFLDIGTPESILEAEGFIRSSFALDR